MNDVAARAGVALKTVSRVLNGEKGVAPGTTRRVREAVAELGFRRNDGARVLRKGHTASIGLIMEDIGDPFYSALSRAVEDVAHANGFLLFTGSSDEDPERERRLALALCARRVDGLIVVPASGDHTYLTPDIDAGIAMVFADRPASGIDADRVLTDNAGGARKGVEHLIGHGHRRIGFIGDRPSIYTAALRRQGYLDAMAAAGLPVAGHWVSTRPPSPPAAHEALAAMLAVPEPITAVFCGNNRTTVTVLRELAAMHASPAVAGFDDFELADLLGVTVVSQHPGDMGHLAAELLFRRLAGEQGARRHIEIATELVVRGSGERAPV
jgi:LacI family transcriptional regulator